MATQKTNPPVAPSAEVVGNAFVEQYYHILHNSPEMVYRFYQDTSVLSCPDINGVMSTVTTLESINDRICSLNYKNCILEIKTADAQESYNGGVIVLVTGCLTGEDNHSRIFTQMFFLAPQDKGYFVLNDVFRYAEACDPKKGAITRDEIAPESLNKDLESDQNKNNAGNLLEEERSVTNVEESVVKAESHLKTNLVSAELESTIDVKEDDISKKSYALIVNRERKKGPTKASPHIEKLLDDSTPRAPELAPEASPRTESSSGTAPESKGSQDEVEGYSIYVSNLPPNITVDQLGTEFMKFGSIKQNGVQVRNNRQEGFSFGFVEFQDLRAMESAIKASRIIIGGRKAAVEIKRSTRRVINLRNRFSPSRGTLRSGSGSLMGRGDFRDGWGYGRVESPGRGVDRRGEGYQQWSRKGGSGDPSKFTSM